MTLAPSTSSHKALTTPITKANVSHIKETFNVVEEGVTKYKQKLIVWNLSGEASQSQR